MGRVPVRNLSTALEHLTNPFALEELTSDGLPLLVVDLTGSPEVGEPRATAAVETLEMVSAVTVAIVDENISGPVADLAEQFDIVLGDGDGYGSSAVTGTDRLADVDTIADSVARNPAASVTLCHILRGAPTDDISRGLIIESVAYGLLQAGGEFAAWLAQHVPEQPDQGPSEPVEPTVLTRRDGGTLHITLNRPTRANAYSAAMRDELVEALRVLAADSSLDGALVNGAGDSFCSGGDLAEFGQNPDPSRAHRVRVARNAGWWIHQRARDIRVRVHGHCVGAGIELPAFAGTVHAEPDAVFRLPEVGMGLIPGAGGTVSIPRRIGRHRTAYMAITGKEIGARQALAWGLVDRVL